MYDAQCGLEGVVFISPLALQLQWYYGDALLSACVLGSISRATASLDPSPASVFTQASLYVERVSFEPLERPPWSLHGRMKD